MATDDGAVFFDVILRCGITHDEICIVHPVMVDVLKDWNYVDVLKPDINTQTGIAEPEKVCLLFGISHVVGGLQLTSCQQVLREDVRRCVDGNSCSRTLNFRTTTLVTNVR